MLVFEPKTAFLNQNLQFLKNVSSSVALSWRCESPHDSRLDVVMNDAKFRVHISSGVRKVNIRKAVKNKVPCRVVAISNLDFVLQCLVYVIFNHFICLALFVQFWLISLFGQIN